MRSHFTFLFSVNPTLPFMSFSTDAGGGTLIKIRGQPVSQTSHIRVLVFTSVLKTEVIPSYTYDDPFIVELEVRNPKVQLF